LALPIRFIGLGESVEDLEPFDPERFAENLLAEAPVPAS
jgi:fused signal recognition particle receptor